MNNYHTDKDFLIASYMAGEDVTGELLQLCRNDPSFAVELAAHVEVERLLQLNALSEENDLFIQEVKARLICEGDEDFVGSVESRIRGTTRRSIAFLWKISAAALFLLSISGWLVLSSHYSVRAVITQQRSALWSNHAYQQGERVRKRMISLEEGCAELNLVNGVRLILEAPSVIEFVKRDQVVLKSGSLVAKVPKKAIGFTVITPSSEVVDLGTEFGVSVNNAGASELCVLEGEVKARGSSDQGFVRMTKNEACEFDVDRQIKMIRSDPSRFMRALPGRSVENPGYLHWSFDGTTQNVPCDGRGIQGKHFDGRLNSFGGGDGPRREKGVFGKALYFNGADAYVETGFPGIGGSAPRTVAFWARVPEGDVEHSGYAMICWGLMAPGAAWQISINPDADEGPLGRMRIGTKVGMVIGSQDLRDNRWHHIAIVMYGGGEADTATHVLIYVDGKLEKTSRKSIADISTRLDSKKSQQLRFGRNLGFREGTEEIADRFFNGWLDEIYIFDAALEQEQIERLMKTNQFY